MIPIELLLEADPSEEAIRDYLYRGIAFGAYLGKQLVGVYIIIKTRPFMHEIINISVKQEFQGKGIGKQLIKHAINYAREAGIKVLEIGTGNSSVSQLVLYQKCGFRIVSIDKDFFKIHYKEKIIENDIECIDMIRLRKIL